MEEKKKTRKAAKEAKKAEYRMMRCSKVHRGANDGLW
jgi:hypothetical protein